MVTFAELGNFEAVAVLTGIVGAEPFRDIAPWSAAELAEREAAVLIGRVFDNREDDAVALPPPAHQA